MKTLVVTDRGEIRALVRFEEGQVEDAPEEIGLEPLEGQQIHEIELPEELKSVDSILDLYEAVEQQYTLDADSARLTRKGESPA